MWKRLTTYVSGNPSHHLSRERSDSNSDTDSTSNLLAGSSVTDSLLLLPTSHGGQQPKRQGVAIKGPSDLWAHLFAKRRSSIPCADPNKPAGWIVKDLDGLENALQTAIEMGPDRGNGLLLALVTDGIEVMPERDRRRAWNACYRAIKSMSGKAAKLSENVVFQPSGAIGFQSNEMPQDACEAYVSGLAQLTQKIYCLSGRDRRQAWDLVFDQLSDSTRPISRDQKGRLASYMAEATSPRFQ